jgi:hypothetical protein
MRCGGRPGDEVLGFEPDVYSSRWTGAALCTPQWEGAELSKAVAWALRSAQHGEPGEALLTVLGLPDKGPNPAFAHRRGRTRAERVWWPGFPNNTCDYGPPRKGMRGA